MRNASLLKVFCVVVASIAFGWAPESAFAQRGGHGGGGMHGSTGGFHGGGGIRGSAGAFHGGGGHYAYGGARYGGYRGGGYYGYRGGGYYGWRGGYYGGWRGGYWGYPRYGYGWGFGIGYGWGAYWPGYAYPYPYYAPYGYPYPDSGYAYPDNGYDYNGYDDAPPPDPGPKSRNNPPVKPSRTPAPGSFPNANSATTYAAASSAKAPLRTTDRTTVTTSTYRPASATQPVPQQRQEVQSAIRAMREMPPYAFQRRIDSGYYNNFTSEEREVVNNSSQYPLNWEKP